MKHLAHLLTTAFLCLASSTASSQKSTDNDPAVKLIEVGIPCASMLECRNRDAIIFVHGIYGSKETFKNDKFDWPREMPPTIEGRPIDIYILEYRTHLLAWLKKDIASFDEIIDQFFLVLQGETDPEFGTRRNGILVRRPYRSVGFIAHSLGGNFVASYIHTVKSELGHEERAQNSFLVTLGTPANGAQIANLGAELKSRLGMRDPLLNSLKRDNTFLRMLARWRHAEDAKASRFSCRPVHLYVGIEGSSTYGIQVVSRRSAEAPYDRLAKEIKFFQSYNHSRIAKPSGEIDPLYVWVNDILKHEIRRLDEWHSPELCSRVH